MNTNTYKTACRPDQSFHDRTKGRTPDPINARVRIYDNGGPSCRDHVTFDSKDRAHEGRGTIDRFTAIYLDVQQSHRGPYVNYVAMDCDPFHPQGFGQHGEMECTKRGRPLHGYLGELILFEELPEPCQRLIRQDLS